MHNKEQSSTRHEAAAHPFLGACTFGRRKRQLNSLKSYNLLPRPLLVGHHHPPCCSSSPKTDRN
uniref:Uncharacterized protein n=1 Tax=Anguilla anguilla TaxID=7936 RepID=A0A0E9T131_ANGAN